MTPTRELNLTIMHASFSSKSHPSLNRPFTAQMTTYRPAFINMWGNQNVCSKVWQAITMTVRAKPLHHCDFWADKGLSNNSLVSLNWNCSKNLWSKITMTPTRELNLSNACVILVRIPSKAQASFPSPDDYISSGFHKYVKQSKCVFYVWPAITMTLRAKPHHHCDFWADKGPSKLYGGGQKLLSKP